MILDNIVEWVKCKKHTLPCWSLPNSENQATIDPAFKDTQEVRK